jgi:hypothetical protein
MFWTFRTIGLGTPPPCPVDDAPYTTCCAPTTAPTHRGTLVVSVRRPYTLPDVPPTAAVPASMSDPFSAADYRRKTHGPRTP